MRSLVEEEVDAVITAGIAGLAKIKSINAIAVRDWIREITAKLNAVVGVQCVSGKRSCQFDYRGFKIDMVCKTPEAQAEWALWIHLRSSASSQGLLKALPGESELASSKPGGAALAISADLFKRAGRARQFLHDCLKELPADQHANGDAIQAAREI